MNSPLTFVLVHGGWHGGWCWKKLTPLLRRAGHEVYTPTLTGLGERSHLLTPEVGLDTHVRDILAVLEYEDLKNVVLVGHSYGGMVITGVAEKAAERLSELVYLDAFLPEHGKCLQDYAPPNPVRDDGWRMPVPAPPQAFGVTDEADVAWMAARLGDHPATSMTQSLELSASGKHDLRRTYILCLEFPPLLEAAGRAKQQGFRYRELLGGGHDAMITRPEELATILLEPA